MADLSVVLFIRGVSSVECRFSAFLFSKPSTICDQMIASCWFLSSNQNQISYSSTCQLSSHKQDYFTTANWETKHKHAKQAERMDRVLTARPNEKSADKNILCELCICHPYSPLRLTS